jgi:hypothetical protein
MTALCELFSKYASDKCPQIFHSYSPEYYKLLKDYKDTYTDILEIGIGTHSLMDRYIRNASGREYQLGGSLKAWRDFFKNAQIYGLDFEKTSLFEDERISCFFTDQSKEEELEKTISNIKASRGDENLLFDFIMDDGSHRGDHQITSLNCLYKYLKKGGLYIIEDVFPEWLHVYPLIGKDEKGIPNVIPGMELIKIHIGQNHPRGQDTFIVYRKSY